MIGPAHSIDQMRTSTMYAVRATRAAAQPNSYMLPHGTRSAASPRLTTPASSTSVARTVSEKPMPPATSERSSATSSGAEAGAPAPDQLTVRRDLAREAPLRDVRDERQREDDGGRGDRVVGELFVLRERHAFSSSGGPLRMRGQEVVQV